ncbi:unnamed protein product [Staurois parvus]|uniref:HMG box domain-containing protein n=1 Tax=Staurois parvus TaxID=386267 RepID=A0ABN9GES1_9NEOB|nr:unnamed protein product [Staurois parvus]
MFCSEYRPHIKSENPGLSTGDTAKKLGELWAEQSPKDKQPYEQKAAKLNEKVIAAYQKNGNSDIGKKVPGRLAGSKKIEPEADKDEEGEEDKEKEDHEDDE